MTAPSRDAARPAATDTAGGRAGALARAGAWLAGRSDRAVLLACLVGIAAGVGLFLVLPLAPQFVPM
ncbi:MAG TPA: hypothetical protein VGA45_20245, partial [Actinomycetota bacterium]